jgi:DNA-binding transcriptional MerR regulator
MEPVWSRDGSLWWGGIDSETCDCHDTAMPDDERYSLTELADLAGVTPRTVRYYLAGGLLPAVGQTGPGSKYTAGHLARLQLIRRLQAEHLPLAEIRRRLETLGDEEIRDLVGASEPAPPTDTALEYLRTVLGGSLADRAGVRPDLQPMVPPPLRMAGERPASASVAPAAGLASRSLAEAPGEPYQPSPGPAPADATVRPSDRSQWERIVLVPDVELHIRRPLARAQNKQVDRLVTIARELLEEDRP